jgi:hypothetical protein
MSGLPFWVLWLHARPLDFVVKPSLGVHRPVSEGKQGSEIETKTKA